MSARLVPIFLFALMIFTIHRAEACDPNESCGGKCVVSAFGHCVQHGNDIQCEIRKKSCQNEIEARKISPFPLPPDINPLTPSVLGMPVQDCIANLAACPRQVAARFGYYAVLAPFIEPYIAELKQQANGHWKTLPQGFIDQVASFYPVDLHRVRYAPNVDTGHGRPMTLGYDIYIPGDFDLSTAENAYTMYHELQHVVQYEHKGGVQAFLMEYLSKGGGQMTSQRKFEIHDDIDLEIEAIHKSEEVALNVTSRFAIQNNCAEPLAFAIVYLKANVGWVPDGIWNIDPGTKEILKDNNGDPLTTKDRFYYLYAEKNGRSLATNGQLLPLPGSSNDKGIYVIRDSSKSAGPVLLSDVTCH